MPLTFDLPLDQLKTYTGINPRPADFDQYWKAALDEMRSLDPQVELVPAEFQAPNAECYHLYFTGVGGSRIHAKLLRPKNNPDPHPAVLMFHGYRWASGDWVEKLAYVSQGFTVAAMDCRGQGGLSEDRGGTASGNSVYGHIIRGLEDALNGRPESLQYRQIFLDTAQLAKIVMDMPDVDENRVGATGGSQGGALTVACAALEPRIKRAAPIFPFLSDYRRVWEIDLAVDAYLELKDFFRHFDPRHEREAEVFEKLGYIDIQHLADRICGEVMWTIGLMDTICPPSSQFAAYNKITAPKSMVIYPDFGHENLPGINDKIFEFMMGL
ncbi:MAG: acetylxylan esterase [Chloroflexi bacterium]|nr:acetylxylan esterase [Chloroflexota bacterium]